jgi:Flp pilus assembly pilin Flp
MKTFLTRLWNEEEGQDLTEYALVLALMVLGAVAFMGTIGNTVKNVFSNTATALTSATT